ncbi:MAG: DUF190 domain-containing protein [Acidobacteriota bacterium]
MTTKLQLTIYIKQADTSGDLAMYEAIIRHLHHAEVAGATVLRGSMGYGRDGHVHRKGLLGISDDHPMMIVTIDDAAKIEAVLPALREMVKGALMTLQEVSIP